MEIRDVGCDVTLHDTTQNAALSFAFDDFTFQC